MSQAGSGGGQMARNQCTMIVLVAVSVLICVGVLQFARWRRALSPQATVTTGDAALDRLYAMRRWVEANGGKVSPLLQFARSDGDSADGGGFGWWAAQDIPENHELLRVPYRLLLGMTNLNASGLCPACFQLMYENAAEIYGVQSVRDLEQEEVSGLVMGLFLSLQRFHFSAVWDEPTPDMPTDHYPPSFWQPYIRALPANCLTAVSFAALDPEPGQDPDFGAFALRLMLGGTLAYHEFERMRLAAEQAWRLLRSAATNSEFALPSVYRHVLSESLTLHQFVWGMCTYHSRWEPLLPSEDTAQIPVSDNCNYDNWNAWQVETTHTGIQYLPTPSAVPASFVSAHAHLTSATPDVRHVIDTLGITLEERNATASASTTPHIEFLLNASSSDPNLQAASELLQDITSATENVRWSRWHSAGHEQYAARLWAASTGCSLARPFAAGQQIQGDYMWCAHSLSFFFFFSRWLCLMEIAHGFGRERNADLLKWHGMVFLWNPLDMVCFSASSIGAEHLLKPPTDKTQARRLAALLARVQEKWRWKYQHILNAYLRGGSTDDLCVNRYGPEPRSLGIMRALLLPAESLSAANVARVMAEVLAPYNVPNNSTVRSDLLVHHPELWASSRHAQTLDGLHGTGALPLLSARCRSLLAHYPSTPRADRRTMQQLEAARTAASGPVTARDALALQAARLRFAEREILELCANGWPPLPYPVVPK
jgi:hypothetical protein